ncbi:DUF2644 domain-containing protein [Vibrio algicola]|uniref:DUF2644 domain-containing protein n=1 Tax=Vibrio algicola TaxID=2662262 RepID=A0A5Q0TGP3_9VIBR|nr:DUF2644 domain-containing protein [Vibrio algicola]
MPTTKPNALKELFTNDDNRTSTTGTLHVLGFFVLSAVLLYSVYLDRSYVPELFTTLAIFSGGAVVTKGAVSAYKSKVTKVGS